jgi:hypothetical protein
MRRNKPVLKFVIKDVSILYISGFREEYSDSRNHHREVLLAFVADCNLVSDREVSRPDEVETKKEAENNH